MNLIVAILCNYSWNLGRFYLKIADGFSNMISARKIDGKLGWQGDGEMEGGQRGEGEMLHGTTGASCRGWGVGWGRVCFWCGGGLSVC